MGKGRVMSSQTINDLVEPVSWAQKSGKLGILCKNSLCSDAGALPSNTACYKGNRRLFPGIYYSYSLLKL